jgi:hypothetical protein
MAGKINPFAKEVRRNNALETLKETLNIEIAAYDRGSYQWDSVEGAWSWVENIQMEPVITFAVNQSRGTGRQVIPASEFLDYVSALQAIIDSDFREPEGADRTTYVPTNVVAAQSFKMVHPREVGSDGKVYSDKGGERNVVSVRCTGGKGAKPMMVEKSQFVEVVSTLARIAESLDQYEEQAWTNAAGQQE